MDLSTPDKMRACLHQTFKVLRLDIMDDSRQHAGHQSRISGGGGHYRLMLVSPDFEGKPLLERHRMVFSALSSIQAELHALSFNAMTPAEAVTRGIELP